MGSKLCPGRNALRADRMGAAAARAPDRAVRYKHHQSTLSGRLYITRNAGPVQHHASFDPGAHGDRDRRGVDVLYALLPENRALVGFRVWNSVRVFRVFYFAVD